MRITDEMLSVNVRGKKWKYLKKTVEHQKSETAIRVEGKLSLEGVHKL